ncbi:MAG: nucleoside monophosphate kinase [Parcubacteria group bacterium]|nr:nucleoside monophosphate kinase [Parcubacteria group bacterium]
MVSCYRSGPIERDPASAFHAKNQLDGFLRKNGFTIIGDTFEILKSCGRPQTTYGPEMKKLRNQGRFSEYSKKELLLAHSLNAVRKTDFVVSRPAPEASGGTTSETVVMWLRTIPKLVIIGPHSEGLLDNNSTFMIKMLSDNPSLIFNTERQAIDFISDHIEVFKRGRSAIHNLIVKLRKLNPYINDRPKPCYSKLFDGRTVIIQGQPGAGKDTQGRMLQDLCGFKFFGSGYELRRLSSRFPVLAESLGKGNLAPEVIIKFLFTQSLIKLEKFEPIVFSGTPKKLGEAQALMDMLELLSREPLMIVIDISEELAKERILLRRVCDDCEISFCDEKLINHPICPECGGSLKIRAENTTQEAIDKIFNWYKTDVEEVIRYFENLGLVVHIDGNRGKEEIFNDILEILKR